MGRLSYYFRVSKQSAMELNNSLTVHIIANMHTQQPSSVFPSSTEDPDHMVFVCLVFTTVLVVEIKIAYCCFR